MPGFELAYVDRARAKRFDFFLYRDVNAADYRGNQHDGDDAAHNHTKDSQKRTQFVSQQRRQRHP